MAAKRWAIVLAAAMCAAASSVGEGLPEGVERVLELPPGPDNPRNSEGDFIVLRDGRVLFVYTHFVGGAGDHDTAHLMARVSNDAGRTWTGEDTLVLSNEADMNVMSVSLLRLNDGRIALFYLRKNATDDCRPYVRFSKDETATWSAPRCCAETPVGYYVVNNDRVVQLESGRIIVPAARHALKGEKFGPGRGLCFLSDDAGETWRCSKTLIEPSAAVAKAGGLQEPAVFAVEDGRLAMLCRTGAGCQYRAFSTDKGDTWSAAEPTDLLSPRSPASIERLPGSGDLLLVWNDHRSAPKERHGKRTPLTVAVSKDEGQTWTNTKNIETNPNGWYCYTAIEFVDGAVLLGLCAGDRRENNGLAYTQVLRFDETWLDP